MFKTVLVMLVAMMFSICSPVDAAASVGGIGDADVLSVLLLWLFLVAVVAIVVVVAVSIINWKSNSLFSSQTFRH